MLFSYFFFGNAKASQSKPYRFTPGSQFEKLLPWIAQLKWFDERNLPNVELINKKEEIILTSSFTGKIPAAWEDIIP